MGHESSDFLPNLTAAFIQLDHSAAISTKDFADACARVLPIFDHIGTVFLIAKHEFSGKRDSLVAVAQQYPTLADIVAAGKSDGSIVKKNSPGRNLHRLTCTLSFISAIFENLSLGMELRDAVAGAYDKTLSLIHTWVVRTGIKAGMMALPSTASFLASIGETEETAREHAGAFMGAAAAIVSSITELYSGLDIPRSDFSVSSLWS